MSIYAAAGLILAAAGIGVVLVLAKITVREREHLKRFPAELEHGDRDVRDGHLTHA